MQRQRLLRSCWTRASIYRARGESIQESAKKETQWDQQQGGGDGPRGKVPLRRGSSHAEHKGDGRKARIPERLGREMMLLHDLAARWSASTAPAHASAPPPPSGSGGGIGSVFIAGSPAKPVFAEATPAGVVSSVVTGDQENAPLVSAHHTGAGPFIPQLVCQCGRGNPDTCVVAGQTSSPFLEGALTQAQLEHVYNDAPRGDLSAAQEHLIRRGAPQSGIQQFGAVH